MAAQRLALPVRRHREPSTSRCWSCITGIWAFLDPDSEDNSPKSSASPVTGRNFPSITRPEILSTALPLGWGRNGSGFPTPPSFEDLSILRAVDERPLAKPGGMKAVSSMPSFLDGPSFPSPRDTTPQPALSAQEQCVELRPLAADGWAPLMQAKSMPVVVFANVPSGSGSEFVLQFKDDYSLNDDEQPCWCIPFNLTKLPPGMHMFYFLVDGTRMLSSTYPIIGDMNAAIFSDSFRRYIIGHGKFVGEASGGANKFLRAVTSDHEAPQRMSSFMLSTPPKESGMKRRVASYSQGLSDLGEEQAEPQTPSNVKEDMRKTPTALFSESVFADLYDNELPLRLHPSVLRGLDWGAKNLGGSLQLWSGSARVGKQHGHCEDACFVSTSAVGVADGVGGMSAFSSFGVNSAKLAGELMEGASYACESIRIEHPGMIAQECALEAMRRSEDGAQSFGASTMTVAVVRQSELGVANLGDSGFMILRRGKQRLEILARSTEQHHRWNCPFQLTRLPPELAKKFPGFACDTPKDSDMYTCPIQEGDLLLLFTDGLRDNLHDKEIRHVTECALPPGISHLVGLPEYKTAPESIAKALALAAFERSRDPKAMVPFAKGCRKNGYDYEGGKEDDITVVAAWVVQDSGVKTPDQTPGGSFIRATTPDQ